MLALKGPTSLNQSMISSSKVLLSFTLLSDLSLPGNKQPLVSLGSFPEWIKIALFFDTWSLYKRRPSFSPSFSIKLYFPAGILLLRSGVVVEGPGGSKKNPTICVPLILKGPVVDRFVALSLLYTIVFSPISSS